MTSTRLLVLKVERWESRIENRELGIGNPNSATSHVYASWVDNRSLKHFLYWTTSIFCRFAAERFGSPLWSHCLLLKQTNSLKQNNSQPPIIRLKCHPSTEYFCTSTYLQIWYVSSIKSPIWRHLNCPTPYQPLNSHNHSNQSRNTKCNRAIHGWRRPQTRSNRPLYDQSRT